MPDTSRPEEQAEREQTMSTVPFGEHETWYRVVGDLSADKPPLVLLHGGPGATHQYLLAMAGAGRPRARGRALRPDRQRRQHPPARAEGDGDFWTMPLFVDELANLVAHLGITDHHVLGQSWGGFLAQEHALTHPAGLRSVVLADTAASWTGFLRRPTSCARCCRPRSRPCCGPTRLPGPRTTRPTPKPARSSTSGTCAGWCRMPPDVAASFAAIDSDPTVYHTMNGPSEFHCIGTAIGWTALDRLHDIDVPALLVSGAHDEAAPWLQEQLRAGIPDCTWELFADSSHMPHVEETETFLQVVGDWLDAHDA